MSGDALPETLTAEDFRALARSSPWRFSTVHFTHRRQRDSGSTPSGAPVEAWLDRGLGRVVVRSSAGVEVAQGPPYGAAVRRLTCDDDAECPVPPPRRSRRCGCCPLLDSPASRIHEYGPEDPTLVGGGLATVYRVHLDVQTGIVVDLTPLDGTEGNSLTNEIHDVDEPLDPPL